MTRRGPASFHPSQIEVRSAKAIGQRIKQIRAGSGLTQKEFAKTIGATEDAFAQYEAGERRPDIAIAGRIVDVYRVSLDYLYLGRISGLSPEIAAKIRGPTD
jgi:transcriptional regulator with XRE-family HTH domain